jgi:hypothetical protein
MPVDRFLDVVVSAIEMGAISCRIQILVRIGSPLGGERKSHDFFWSHSLIDIQSQGPQQESF